MLALYSLLKSNPLLANDIHLLLQQDGFPISMLNEIRHFTQYLEKHIGTESHFISPHLFNEAIANLNQQFQDSSKLDSVLRHINDFQKRHQDLTLSYWLSYISEVQIEQFDTDQSSRIVISTIHRAKGKEFDEVHVVIPEKHHQDQPDYFFRLYYVALSRAKKSLHIHSGDNNLFRPLLRKCQKVHHHESSPKPESIHQIWIMTLQDINLGFLQRSENKDRLRYVQKEQILSGEEVTLNHYESEGKWNIVRQKTAIAQLSNNFTQRLEKALKTHKLLTATIEYTAHWQSPESSLESPIFLYRLELQPQ